MTYPDEPMFYTVFCFEPAADRNAQPRHSNSAHIQRLTPDQVITRLVKDRLRELADALDRLAAADAKDRLRELADALDRLAAADASDRANP